MLEHVALTVADNKELENFYRNILGFELHKTFELNEDLSKKIFGISKNMSVYHLKKDNLILEIFISVERSKLKYNHICLLIKNREAVCKNAVANGYICNRIKRDRGDLIFIQDKSSNMFEIKEG
jgi:catechol 2,3-dioxygenase-like lactoylglutathione lyase family enzyme